MPDKLNNTSARTEVAEIEPTRVDMFSDPAQGLENYAAHRDALTKLPNRALFMDRLEQALARAKIHNRLLALMLIDIHGLKNIDNAFGRNVGERALLELAARLKNSVRAEDTVARLGGDEFAILLDDLSSINDAPPLADKILAQA